MAVPARGDHDARRRDVSQAVWEVLAAGGFGGLTLRAVAARMGASTGLLTHYFPSKKALMRYALEVAHEHTQVLDRFPAEGEGLPGLRAALLDVMPLTAESAARNRVWVSFWDAALGDDELAAAELRRYERWRGMLRPHVDAALRRGQLPADADPDDVVATAAGFGHGLVVQALFDPARFPPQRQVKLVDDFVALLAARRRRGPHPTG
ncbi:TetR/AcrR family transcriptional regulator [Catellatospora chokoriensis]|uniref:TetR family transcriptional regulator n=1 Tax=Catellatospora chokoriensis TaxID=310353 RepID=A0A8J3K3H4_9ACTN|nr:TetR family transcriptional regulator [Catellatospora chokoriensis]